MGGREGGREGGKEGGREGGKGRKEWEGGREVDLAMGLFRGCGWKSTK